MKLIEDLGTREYGNQGKVKRYGLYKCPVCHKHFECRVGSVKSGHTTKCRDCADKARNKDIVAKAASEFIGRARAIHGDLYNYLLVNYTNIDAKIKIICPIHGVFEQTPYHHLKGHGCPSCASSGFDKAKPAIVYYLKIMHSNIIAYKIGITNRSVERRFSSDDLTKITVLETWKYLLGDEAYEHEQQILKQYAEYKYTGEPLLSSGNTELFTIDVLGLDVTLK